MTGIKQQLETVTHTIQLSREMESAFREQAQAEGLELEAWLIQAARRALPDQTRSQLIDKKFSGTLTADEAEMLKSIDDRLEAEDAPWEVSDRVLRLEANVAELGSQIRSLKNR